MDSVLVGAAGAFGLAAAAGLNTSLPLLLVGLAARLGLLTLATPYDALSTNVALTGLALLAGLEIVADKMPGVDSLAHAVQWPLTLAAGAILFGGQHSIVRDVSPGLAVLVGLVTAGGVHTLRSIARPAINLTTLGLGAPLVSALEDFSAFAISAAALLAPPLALGLLLALLLAVALLVLWAGTRLRPAQASSPLEAPPVR